MLLLLLLDFKQIKKYIHMFYVTITTIFLHTALNI